MAKTKRSNKRGIQRSRRKKIVGGYYSGSSIKELHLQENIYNVITKLKQSPNRFDNYKYAIDQYICRILSKLNNDQNTVNQKCSVVNVEVKRKIDRQVPAYDLYIITAMYALVARYIRAHVRINTHEDNYALNYYPSTSNKDGNFCELIAKTYFLKPTTDTTQTDTTQILSEVSPTKIIISQYNLEPVAQNEEFHNAYIQQKINQDIMLWNKYATYRSINDKTSYERISDEQIKFLVAIEYTLDRIELKWESTTDTNITIDTFNFYKPIYGNNVLQVKILLGLVCGALLSEFYKITLFNSIVAYSNHILNFIKTSKYFNNRVYNQLAIKPATPEPKNKVVVIVSRADLNKRLNEMINPNVSNPNINNWDVSAITDMSYLFANMPYFNEDISNWDVSNVTNMEGMFRGCFKFNQPIGNWNVSNVRNMKGMFERCQKFNQPIGNWNVTKVTDMERMFSGCFRFNQPLENWERHDDPDNQSTVRHVMNMEEMFRDCMDLDQPQSFGKWIISKDHEMRMSSMFYGCKVNNQPENWYYTSLFSKPHDIQWNEYLNRNAIW